ncbi:F0F1 ATP synthase subunit B [Rurimicrobium arvi]|uniref:ATP synthase subunit b n=1 Tax=Rurimicrobium arvi TaxID=2049916 RepID=A0ABP8MMH6_9BACT
MDLLQPDLGLFVWTLVAFLIVFLILKKYAWKPILNSLNEREKNIADSIASAERVKAEMATMQAENQKIMAEAREERTQMLKEAKELKDKIVNDAKEQAKTEAAKIMADARVQIDHLKMAAMTEVKNEVANLALQVAEKVIRKNLSSDADQSAFAKKLAEEVSLN